MTEEKKDKNKQEMVSGEFRGYVWKGKEGAKGGR